MMKQLIGIPALVLGLAMLAFSVMGWTQLRSAATHPSPDPADYPLLQLMMSEPEAGGPPPRPAELARNISFTLYSVGGVGLLLVIAGGVVCFGAKKSPEET